MSEATELADKLFEVSTKCDHHYSLDRSAAAELHRLHARSEEQERLLRDALEALGEGSGWMTRVRLITAIRKHLGE